MKNLLLILTIFINTTYAEVIYDDNFKSQALQQRYHTLIEEIRCPVCQGQSIGGSHAPLAQDLRGVVIKMLKTDKSDSEIFDFMRERYGDFVVFTPPVNNQTYLLWFAPFLFVVLALVLLMRNRNTRVKQPIDIDKSAKAQQLLETGD